MVISFEFPEASKNLPNIFLLTFSFFIEWIKKVSISRFTSYTYSINNYETALKNLTLAESIEKKNQIKFYEGLASSFDLRQAQNQLYTIQNEYLEATLKIIENKINLEILLNKS